MATLSYATDLLTATLLPKVSVVNHLEGHQERVHKLCHEINNARTIALFSHHKPDADAYGSLIGLGEALKSLGKEVVLVNYGYPPEEGSSTTAQTIRRQDESFSFLKGFNEIQISPERDTCDLSLVLDCASLSRIGETNSQWLDRQPRPPWILDHHLVERSNKGNFIESLSERSLICESAQSTSQLVIELIALLEEKEGRLLLNSSGAESLYCGMIGDIGLSLVRTEKYASYINFIVTHGGALEKVEKQLFGTFASSAADYQKEVLKKVEVEQLGVSTAVYWIVPPLVNHEILPPEIGRIALGNIHSLVLAAAQEINSIAVALHPEHSQSAEHEQCKVVCRAKGDIDFTGVSERLFPNLSGKGNSAALKGELPGSPDKIKDTIRAILLWKLAQASKE